MLQMIGIEQEILDNLDATRLVFQHPQAIILGLILLVPVAVWILRRQRRNLGSAGPLVIGALTALRILILLLMIMVLGAPRLVLNYQRSEKPAVAFLVDHSASMFLPAGPFTDERETAGIAAAAGYSMPSNKPDPDVIKALNRISRVKLANTAIGNATNLFRALASNKMDLAFYELSNSALNLCPASNTPPRLPEPVAPGGSATLLGDALHKLLDESLNRPLAGIILFSDGQNNGGRPPLEAARRAAELGVRFYTIPCAGTATVSDVTLIDLDLPGEITLGDTVRITATIESHGFDGKTATIRVLETNQVLDSREIILTSREQQQADLSFVTGREGIHPLTVEIVPLAGEPEHLQGNNNDQAVLEVNRDKIRVLYLEGLPRWDFRFLKNAMRRDHGLGGLDTPQPVIAVETEVRLLAPEQQRQAVPQNVEQWAAYQAVILGDLSPNILGALQLQALSTAVRERGTGLLIQAGPLHMPQSYAEEFGELLPVKCIRRLPGLDAPTYRPFTIDLAPEGVFHEIMRLVDEPERNRSIWLQMPPFYWCAAAERAAAGATILAWNPAVGGRLGAVPLIAWHQAGAGKVLFVGTDSTWTWRQNVGDRYFYRFWGQAIRFVARQPEGIKTSRLAVRPPRVSPGQPVYIELMAYTREGLPRAEETLKTLVTGGTAMRQVQLNADRSRRGRFSGSFIAEKAGIHNVIFEPGDGGPVLSGEVRVTPALLELRHAQVQRPILRALAEATGGRMLELPQLGTIGDQFHGVPKLTRVQREASLWDNWLVLLLLAVLYSLDVGIRRLRGLS